MHDLGHPARVVEADEDVGDDEAALGQVAAGVGQRHRRLELRDVVVADVADNRVAAGLCLRHVHEPRPAADERVAAEPPALDGLEQEARPACVAQLEVRAERRDQVSGYVGNGHRHGQTKRPSGWKV